MKSARKELESLRKSVYERVRKAALKSKGVRLSAHECFSLYYFDHKFDEAFRSVSTKEGVS